MPREFKKLHVVSVNQPSAMRKGNVARDAQPLQDDTTLDIKIIQFCSSTSVDMPVLLLVLQLLFFFVMSPRADQSTRTNSSQIKWLVGWPHEREL